MHALTQTQFTAYARQQIGKAAMMLAGRQIRR
jgi:hypothetical protein